MATTARPVFSSVFYAANPAPSSLSEVGGPDASHVWVVRDIVAINSAVWSSAASGIYVADTAGAYMLWLTDTDVTSGRLYHWTGRQVIDHTDQLVILAGDENWSLRVSGYNLTVS